MSPNKTLYFILYKFHMLIILVKTVKTFSIMFDLRKCFFIIQDWKNYARITLKGRLEKKITEKGG